MLLNLTLCLTLCLSPGESSHLALNKLKCPHCNYIAKHRRTLKRHLIIHSGVRSFSCDICGKLFTRREHVKRHSLVSWRMHRILSSLSPPSPYSAKHCGALSTLASLHSTSCLAALRSREWVQQDIFKRRNVWAMMALSNVGEYLRVSLKVVQDKWIFEISRLYYCPCSKTWNNRQAV